MINNQKAIIFAVISAILWSTVATAFKFALQHFDVLSMLFYSTWFSFIFLLLFGAFNNKLRSTFQVSKRSHLNSFILGLLNPLIYYIVLFKAYELLPAQEAQTLNYSWSITVVIFSAIFLKQRLKLLNFIALIISFIGVIIIATKGNPFAMEFDDPIGVTLALGSSIFWALYWVFNLKDKRDNLQKLILNFFYGSILITVINLFFNDFSLSLDVNLLYCAYIGLFEMGVTFVTWMLALKYAENSAKVSNIIYISPFLSLFWINIFLNEPILKSTIIGLILIISGIILQNRIKRTKP